MAFFLYHGQLIQLDQLFAFGQQKPGALAFLYDELHTHKPVAYMRDNQFKSKEKNNKIKLGTLTGVMIVEANFFWGK